MVKEIMSRGGFKIQKVEEEQLSGDRIDWLDSFAQKIENVSNATNASVPRTAVEVARRRNYQSIIDQISSIVGGKAQPNAVEAKVREMQDRTGLNEWLKRQAQVESSLPEDPNLFGKVPESVKEDIKNFIWNLISTHHGNIQVPAVVEEVSRIFKSKGVTHQDVNDMAFEKYISDQIVKAKKNEPMAEEHNTNIGRGLGVEKEVDPESGDAFSGLNPVKQ